MNKIPTIFLRDWENDPSRVTRQWNPEAEWLLDNPHSAIATVKRDGTNVRVTVTHYGNETDITLEKRRNPSKKEKRQAEGAGLPVPEPTYAVADPDDSQDKHIFAAFYETDFSDWPDGVWECEALGPKIQGGVESDTPCLYPFSFDPNLAFDPIANLDPFELTPSKIYNAIEAYFTGMGGPLQGRPIEGIVWHGPDGRMAKIKRRDFGLPWPPEED
jgi:hypothetical protein